MTGCNFSPKGLVRDSANGSRSLFLFSYLSLSLSLWFLPYLPLFLSFVFLTLSLFPVLWLTHLQSSPHTMKFNLVFPSFLGYFSLEIQNSNPCSKCSFSLWYISVPNSNPNLIGWDSLWLQSGSTWLDWRLARGYNHSLLRCYKRPKHTHIRPLKTSCHTKYIPTTASDQQHSITSTRYRMIEMRRWLNACHNHQQTFSLKSGMRIKNIRQLYVIIYHWNC